MQTLPQHTNRGQLKSTEELTRLMQDILERARRKGATDACVNVNYDEGFSVDVRMGQVETVTFNEDRGASLVIYIGKQKGVASSTDISPSSLDAMVSAAYEIAKVSAADPCYGLPDKELMTNEYPPLDLCYPWDVTPQQAIEMAVECERKALAMDQRIVNSDGVNLSTYTLCHGFANTEGGMGTVESSRHSISCSLVAKKDESMQRDYDYTTARKADALLNSEALARSAVERTTSRLGARKVKTQSAPVIFSSRLSSGLFSSFINAVSGSNLYRKNSFLLDSLGKSVFPAFINIHEQPHILRGLGSSPFDGEGVLTRNNIIVDQGVLSQYVLNTYSARRLGLKTTANCGGVFNLTIDPTADDLPSLLAMMGKGLLVTELMGQGANILTGDYSRGANGFWVENGEIQYPVEEITIAGNLKDMYKGILAVGHDWNPNISTQCGSVLIDKMVIAGSN